MDYKTWAERIRQHALTHYMEDDGWDILVECWTDEYITENYSGCKTYEQAVIQISETLSVMNSWRKEMKEF